MLDAAEAAEDERWVGVGLVEAARRDGLVDVAAGADVPFDDETHCFTHANHKRVKTNLRNIHTNVISYGVSICAKRPRRTNKRCRIGADLSRELLTGHNVFHHRS